MNKRRYAVRHAKKIQPRSVQALPNGNLRVVRADGTVVIGRPTRRVNDQVDAESGTPDAGPE